MGKSDCERPCGVVAPAKPTVATPNTTRPSANHRYRSTRCFRNQTENRQEKRTTMPRVIWKTLGTTKRRPTLSRVVLRISQIAGNASTYSVGDGAVSSDLGVRGGLGSMVGFSDSLGFFTKGSCSLLEVLLVTRFKNRPCARALPMRVTKTVLAREKMDENAITSQHPASPANIWSVCQTGCLKC